MKLESIWTGIGFGSGMLFLASIYPVSLHKNQCPNFLSLETCDITPFTALVAELIFTTILTLGLAYYIYVKTEQSTRKNMRDIIQVELASFSENLFRYSVDSMGERSRSN